MQRHTHTKRPQFVVHKKQHANNPGNSAEPERTSSGQLSYQPGNTKTHADAQNSKHKEKNTDILNGTKPFECHEWHDCHDDGSIQRLQGKQDQKRRFGRAAECAQIRTIGEQAFQFNRTIAQDRLASANVLHFRTLSAHPKKRDVHAVKIP